MTRLLRLFAFISGVVLVLPAPLARAGMEPMADGQLSETVGEGIALELENFRIQAAPTSYIEQIGSATNPADTTFQIGTLRWFGLTLSGAATGAGNQLEWNGTCADGINSMGCPMGVAGIANYANHDNPFVLRAFDYQRVGCNGVGAACTDWLGGVVDPSTGVSAGGIQRTVLELLGPSNSDVFRWAFWGEAESRRSSDNVLLGTLQNFNLIRGRPAARRGPPSILGTVDASNPFEGPVLQMFENQSDDSMGMLYLSRLSGDYRFSVNVAATDANGVPDFTDEEGLYFTNVNAYLPMGTLHYQALILDDLSPGSTNPGTAGNGNFVIQLTRLPNDAEAYNDFYSSAGDSGYRRYGRNGRYYQTHGYVEWGSAFPTCAGGGANGAQQCMSGSGVSTVRYSGFGDPDGPVRVINNTNFPNPNACGSNDCNRWEGTRLGRTLAQCTSNPFQAGCVGGYYFSDSTRSGVVAAGGISFVSRNSTTYWTLPNNQNLPVNNGGSITKVTDFWPDCGVFAACRELGRETNYNPSNPLLNLNAINLGTSRVEGLLIQHMKITSLGAGS